MSAEFWAIIGVGAAVVLGNLIAATENEKRLDRIIRLLEASIKPPPSGDGFD